MSIYSIADGKTYLHYENWVKYRKELCDYYPCQRGKFRADVELIRPTLFLPDVKVDRNPHNLGGFEAHACFYACDDWTTIFDIQDDISWLDGTESIRFIMESGNPEPIKGERAIIYSTSSTVWNEPWGRNKSNHFAFFRNRFWFVSHIEFLHEWKGNLNYPLVDHHKDGNRCWLPEGNYGPEDFVEPSYLKEAENSDMKSFLLAVLDNPSDLDTYLIFADYLEELGSPFCDYLRAAVNFGNFSKKFVICEKFMPYYDSHPKNLRTAIFIFCNLLQSAYSAKTGRSCLFDHRNWRGFSELRE